MNAKEAREINKNHTPQNCRYVGGCIECRCAEAYLEAHEKAGGLAEALRGIRSQIKAVLPKSHILHVADEALAKWEEEL